MTVISYEEATQLVLDRCHPLPSQTRPVLDSVGLFLCRPLVGRYDHPRFDCSAVDGYALGAKRSDGPFRLVGCAEAGAPYEGRLGEGECIQVLTGAVVPQNVEAIVMREDCRCCGRSLILERSVRNGDNIRQQGEEYRAGEMLLSAGTLVTPAVAGLATAQGYTTLCLGGAPRVTVLVTGNELRTPDEELGPGAVYASNVTTFVTTVRALGLQAQARLVPDDPALIRAALEEGFETADLVLTTGGVSVGDRDHVRDCSRSIGVEEAFWKVAMKPGKPVFFGLRRGKPMFALPGNPAAAAVTFHLFVRPALLRLMGAEKLDLPTFPVRLGTRLQKKVGRVEFVRVSLENQADGIVARPTAGQDSHMIRGLATADGLLHLPSQRERFEEGDLVPASLLRWSMF